MVWLEAKHRCLSSGKLEGNIKYLQINFVCMSPTGLEGMNSLINRLQPLTPLAELIIVTCSCSREPCSTAACSDSHLATSAGRWCDSGNDPASASSRRPWPARTARSSLLSGPSRASDRSWAADTTPTTGIGIILIVFDDHLA